MKNFKHWLIQKLLKWSKILDIEKALRDKYHEGVEATEKKYEGKINVWWDPTVRSYPQPQKQEVKSQVLHVPPGSLTRAWHDEQQFSGKLPRISQVLPRIRLKPVDQKTKQPVIRTNTDRLDPEKDFPAFLNSTPQEPTFAQAQAMLKQNITEVPTAKNLLAEITPEITEEMPAVVALLHQKRQQERHAS